MEQRETVELPGFFLPLLNNYPAKPESEERESGISNPLHMELWEQNALDPAHSKHFLLGKSSTVPGATKHITK